MLRAQSERIQTEKTRPLLPLACDGIQAAASATARRKQGELIVNCGLKPGKSLQLTICNGMLPIKGEPGYRLPVRPLAVSSSAAT
jgi:hypothetical protein